jgi:hypothetical protein
MNGSQGCLKLESAPDANPPIGIEKKCSQCGEKKDLKLFGKDKHNKDGLTSQGKECRYKNTKRYCTLYPEKRQETMRKWYHKSIEQIRIKHREWSKNNPEKAKRTKYYYDCHRIVRKTRGSPKKCELCGAENLSRYDWANLTGNYDDINDYKRMCKPCHVRYDFKRKLDDRLVESGGIKIL